VAGTCVHIALLSSPLPRGYRSAHQDTTFDFEKRRNRPVKYDREAMGKTLLAMKKVG